MSNSRLTHLAVGALSSVAMIIAFGLGPSPASAKEKVTVGFIGPLSGGSEMCEP